MITLKNVELVLNLSEPTVFFELNDTTYALLVGGSEKVLCGEMDGVDELLTNQMTTEQNWDNETTSFIFDDFRIDYSNDHVTYKVFITDYENEQY